jgi:hypothetical protein
MDPLQAIENQPQRYAHATRRAPLSSTPSSSQQERLIGKGFVQIGDWLHPVANKRSWWRRIILALNPTAVR